MTDHAHHRKKNHDNDAFTFKGYGADAEAENKTDPEPRHPERLSSKLEPHHPQRLSSKLEPHHPERLSSKAHHSVEPDESFTFQGYSELPENGAPIGAPGKEHPLDKIQHRRRIEGNVFKESENSPHATQFDNMQHLRAVQPENHHSSDPDNGNTFMLLS